MSEDAQQNDFFPKTRVQVNRIETTGRPMCADMNPEVEKSEAPEDPLPRHPSELPAWVLVAEEVVERDGPKTSK